MFLRTYRQLYQTRAKNMAEKKAAAGETRPPAGFKQIQPGFYCFSYSSAVYDQPPPGNRQTNVTPYRPQKHFPLDAPERIPGTSFVRAGGQLENVYGRHDLPLYCFS